MKRFYIFLITLLIAVSAFFYAGEASAVIIDLPDAGGNGYFKDTATGYTWMDVDNFFGMNYFAIEAGLLSGYQIASLSQIQAMHSTLTWENYLSWNTILGDNDRGYSRIVWGYYDIGHPNLAGESWTYSDLASNCGDGELELFNSWKRRLFRPL